MLKNKTIKCHLSRLWVNLIILTKKSSLSSPCWVIPRSLHHFALTNTLSSSEISTTNEWSQSRNFLLWEWWSSYEPALSAQCPGNFLRNWIPRARLKTTWWPWKQILTTPFAKLNKCELDLFSNILLWNERILNFEKLLIFY